MGVCLWGGADSNSAVLVTWGSTWLHPADGDALGEGRGQRLQKDAFGRPAGQACPSLLALLGPQVPGQTLHTCKPSSPILSVSGPREVAGVRSGTRVLMPQLACPEPSLWPCRWLLYDLTSDHGRRLARVLVE